MIELNWNELMFFPVVMYGCDSWTIKKTELLRIGMEQTKSDDLGIYWAIHLVPSLHGK